MELRKVVAIIRGSVLEKVEERLKDMGIKGISISRVKGYGEYHNFYKADWMVTNARIEIFVEKSKVDEIASAIMDAAHVGEPGDGIVAVLPVEKLFRIRTKSQLQPEDQGDI
jgi:nitrogen regulatory protein P-II 1